MKVKSEGEVAQSVRLLAAPWTAAYQAPLSMGFSRQGYWSGVPLPSPGYSLGLGYLSKLQETAKHRGAWPSGHKDSDPTQ